MSRKLPGCCCTAPDLIFEIGTALVSKVFYLDRLHIRIQGGDPGTDPNT